MTGWLLALAFLAVFAGGLVLGFCIKGQRFFAAVLGKMNRRAAEQNTADTLLRDYHARTGTLVVDASNAAETLRMVVWMESAAPETLRLWREHYLNWKRRNA